MEIWSVSEQFSQVFRSAEGSRDCPEFCDLALHLYSSGCCNTGSLRTDIVKVDNSPLRRQSSAPARLAVASIDICLEKVRRLSGQVDSLAVNPISLRRKSLSDLNSRNMSQLGETVKHRTCHQCHRPTSDPHHQGLPAGVGHCTLEHWAECPGGKTGDTWSACPLTRPENEENNETVFKNATLPRTVSQAADMFEKAAGLKSVSSTDYSSGDDSSDEEELKIRQAEIEVLKLQAEKAAKDNEKRDKKEARRKERAILLQKLEKEKAELLAQSSSSKAIKSQKVVVDRVASDDLRKKAAEHAAKQQQRSAARAAEKQNDGLTMPDIRSLPGMTPQVEEYLTSVATATLH